MKDLICILYGIKFYSKDIHYSCSGSNFYGDHLLADEICDGIDDLIDQINEKMFLGFEHPAPSSKEIVDLLPLYIPPVSTDVRTMWQNLYSLLQKGIDHINAIEEDYSDAPMNALMDNIADNLQGKKGLLWRRKLSI